MFISLWPYAHDGQLSVSIFTKPWEIAREFWEGAEKETNVNLVATIERPNAYFEEKRKTVQLLADSHFGFFQNTSMETQAIRLPRVVDTAGNGA